ncbi:MAG TPA: phosphoribosyltransferase family protein [Solirubrobacterales bacterium]|nr:phosphoribosyltransferase family protein [Solirubrobacterales bacterium]
MTPEEAWQQIRFADRRDAGRQLGERLLPFAYENPLVIGLPRGGVPVAREVARALHAPLDFLAVRKLGAPHNPEYGIGAVAEDGVRVIDPEAVAILSLRNAVVDGIAAHETDELERRVALYRRDRTPHAVAGHTAIVVDDGVATGVTDTAALRAVRRRGPRRLVLAVPVCPPDTERRLREEADEVICLQAPPRFFGVGQFYEDFSQVSDEEVVSILAEFEHAAV